MSTMTKSERTEIGMLIRKRERVMKAATEERAAQMLAEFDAASATIYAFDDDPVWEAATLAAQAAVDKASQEIADRCEQMGIPKEFAPGVIFNWHGRGQNAVASRRAELRRAAKSKIDALQLEAKTKIERLSLQAQTEVIATGLESAAALEFLQKMPALENMMPPVSPTEIKQLVDGRHHRETNANMREWG